MSAEETGVAAVARFLDEAGVEHEVLAHDPTFSAEEEAQATGEEPRHTAKTLLLHDHAGWRLAVLPANHRLDLDKARRLLGGSRHLRLATEEEMAQGFPAFDVGTLPPVGPQLPLPEAVDVRLLYRDHVVFPAGDHRHGVRLDPRDLIRLAEPRVGDLCEHEGPPRRKDFADLPRI
jgi:Ala-tRNA(Pro) deacylase